MPGGGLYRVSKRGQRHCPPPTGAQADRRDGAATIAKPSTAASLAACPARRRAAGIMESISMTSSAPAVAPSDHTWPG
jgi:hypothetical protein